MSDEWRSGSPYGFLDHSQEEIRRKTSNGTEVTVYACLNGWPVIFSRGERVDLMNSHVVIDAGGLIAFTLDEWRVFVQAVEDAIKREEQTYKRANIIGEIMMQEPRGDLTPEKYERITAALNGID